MPTNIKRSMVGRELLTTAEAAAELELGKDTVRGYCQGEEPRLRAEKFGRDWLIPRSEVERYKRERRDVGRPSAS